VFTEFLKKFQTQNPYPEFLTEILNQGKFDKFEGTVGITARSILEFFGIPWNYLDLFLEFLKNLHKIP
jgi:hypothetical protein